LTFDQVPVRTRFTVGFEYTTDKRNAGSCVLLVDSHAKYYQYSKLLNLHLPSGGGPDYCTS